MKKECKFGLRQTRKEKKLSFNSPLWKRAVAWNRSRRASAYGTVWGDVSKTKTWRNLARNVVVTARF